MDFQDKPVVITTTPTAQHVSVFGPIHLNTAWLEGELQKVVALKPKAVELDLSKATFVSSVGIGILVNFRNTIVRGGGTFRIVAIPRPILRTFKTAYLDTVFGIDASAVVTDPPK